MEGFNDVFGKKRTRIFLAKAIGAEIIHSIRLSGQKTPSLPFRERLSRFRAFLRATSKIVLVLENDGSLRFQCRLIRRNEAGAKPFWSLRQISFVYAKKDTSVDAAAESV